MSEIDQQFIEYVVKSLVGKPDAVQVDRRIDEKGVLLELTVDPEDLGRVIGKRGATAQSLRTLLRALGTKNDARYNLKIIDNGIGTPSHGPAADDTSAPVAASTPVDEDSDAPAAPEEGVETETPEITPAVEEEPAELEEAPAEEEAVAPEDQTSDRLAQTRQELADLDDLDV